LLIDDAYNANPEGSLEAMKVIGSFKPMKRIVVTPGLVELGEKEYECNKALGTEAAKNADIIILVGEKRSIPLKEGVLETKFKQENLYIAKTFNDAVEIFRPMCDKNTVVIFENDLPDNYAK
ncbi:MAG: UDP-N-acetylmuramoyl-tripeptide--D-alanyl-D-alanine ligase, partial [Clostridia bacterium]|nr:UDP-N-acetylmuramoyl-tripeptide--D-alanyl-D-alanine ligase [Clostridia bacterium]